MKSYLINLDKDAARLAFFSQNFEKLGLEFERISAVNGKNYSEHDYQDFVRLRPRKNKIWLRGQMGCFLSHFNTWQLIADGDQEFCAVFEDDVHISDDLKFILQEDISWIPKNVDVIRLETSTNRLLLDSSPAISFKSRSAYKLRSTSWNAGAYILSRSAAKKLVTAPLAEHKPTDILLFNLDESKIANELQILQFHPALCTQDKYLLQTNNQFASNIEFGNTSATDSSIVLKKLNPIYLCNLFVKAAKGYKRIGFE